MSSTFEEEEFSDYSDNSENSTDSSPENKTVQKPKKKGFSLLKKIQKSTSRKNSATFHEDEEQQMRDLKNHFGANTPLYQEEPNQPIKLGQEDHLKNINAHKDTIWKLIVKDDKILSCSSDQTIKIHSLKNHELETTIQCSSPVHSICVAFLEDKILSALENGNINIHKNGNLKPKYTIKAHSQRITECSSNYQDLMVTGSVDYDLK
jgi:hypothetical protein